MEKHIKQTYQLKNAEPLDVAKLITWFDSPQSIVMWAGMSIELNQSPDLVLHQLQQGNYKSFSLVDEQAQLMGFGQIKLLNHRLHLARLIINPLQRGKGLAYHLIEQLIDKGKISFAEFSEASLFVFSTNKIALACYTKMGFVLADWPNNIDELADCQFMTKPFNND